MGSQGRRDGKRKRSLGEVSHSLDSKRTATGNSSYSGASGEKARHRQGIRRIYESYLLLSSKTSEGDVMPFELLLNKTEG